MPVRRPLRLANPPSRGSRDERGRRPPDPERERATGALKVFGLGAYRCTAAAARGGGRRERRSGHTLLSELLALTNELGLTALIEVHNRAELERVLPLRPRVIGINNRDLRTFTTRLETTLELAPLVGHGTVVVSESGIRGPEDVRRVAEAGVRGVLVGEALLRAPDPAAMARDLVEAGR